MPLPIKGRPFISRSINSCRSLRFSQHIVFLCSLLCSFSSQFSYSYTAWKIFPHGESCDKCTRTKGTMPGAQRVLDYLKNEWEIAQCLPSPGIAFSAVNCHMFPDKYTCHSSGKIPEENNAIRNFASGHGRKSTDRQSSLCLHLCSESLMHLGENLFGFGTQGKGLRLFGDLGTMFIASGDNNFFKISIDSSYFCVNVFILIQSFKLCMLLYNILSHTFMLSTT